ncbi:MAG: hypothetical protein ACYDB0_08330 [Acidithiobacillus sp.]
MSEQDNDATWQHGFDPEQDDPYAYGQGNDESPVAGQEPAAEEIVVPQKAGKAKKPKSPNDKKQTMIIVGVAVAAAIGWIGYGILEGKPANTANAGLTPVSALPMSRAEPSMPAPSLPRQTPPPMTSAPVTRTAPPQSAAPSPAVTTPPPSLAVSIPLMSSNGGLPMSVPSAPAASAALPAASQVAATASAASPATATSIAMAALKEQIVQLKSRISQESLQLQAEKTAAKTVAPPPAPKVVYRVIYRDVPATNPVMRSTPSSSHDRAINGIRVIGAAQGTAWLSVQGHRVMAQVGDDVPGLGIVQSISESGMVRGSHGTARP